MSDAIRRIKDSIDLPALVGEYLPLRKSGAQWLAPCPWHADTQPSLRIYVDHVYCFACGAHGTAIDFLAKIEGVSIGAAIKQLSERTGIPLNSKPVSRRQRAYDREEAAFGNWWWRRECARLALRLSAYVRLGDGPESEAAGLLWRSVAALKGAERRALVARCATAEDRQEWRADVEDARWWTGIVVEVIAA